MVPERFWKDFGGAGRLPKDFGDSGKNPQKIQWFQKGYKRILVVPKFTYDFGDSRWLPKGSC